MHCRTNILHITRNLMFRAVRVPTFTSFLNSHILAPKLPQKHFQGYLVIAYNFKGLFLCPFMNVGIKILIGGQMGAIFTLFCSIL